MDIRDLNARIAELRDAIYREQEAIYKTGDPFNDHAAACDELEQELNDLIEQRNTIVGC